ncbi:MAG TPA: DsrE family protein [Casimicrobiaceae bacterium]|nr:DsrE family protein [Casimicrobiaceae bacterium]
MSSIDNWYRAAFAVIVGAVALVTIHAAPAAAAKDGNRVVVQVSDNDPAKWNLALNNAHNLQEALGKNLEIEIVAYGPGIAMLQAESIVGNRIDDAVHAGVTVSACQNTMRGHKLTKADMLNGINYVPAGVVEIMKRQQEGWAYLRP